MLGASIAGGSSHPPVQAAHGLPSLTPAEQQLAQAALAKLNLADTRPTATAALLSGTPQDASTGLADPPTVVGAGSAHLLPGSGSDTFLGGVRNLGADRVVAGSAAATGHSHASLALADTQPASGAHLGGHTIPVAGTTAASFAAGPEQGKGTHTTLTLSDKTTVHVSGVAAHDLKGHLGHK